MGTEETKGHQGKAVKSEQLSVKRNMNQTLLSWKCTEKRDAQIPFASGMGARLRRRETTHHPSSCTPSGTIRPAVSVPVIN